jgi:hypothetical protein
VTEQTRWRIVEIPGTSHLNVELVVETTAPAIVHAIESAAWSNRVVLERIRGEGSKPAPFAGVEAGGVGAQEPDADVEPGGVAVDQGEGSDRGEGSNR